VVGRVAASGGELGEGSDEADRPRSRVVLLRMRDGLGVGREGGELGLNVGGDKGAALSAAGGADASELAERPRVEGGPRVVGGVACPKRCRPRLPTGREGDSGVRRGSESTDRIDAKAPATADVMEVRGVVGESGPVVAGVDDDDERRGMLGRGLETERNDMVSVLVSWGIRRLLGSGFCGFNGTG